MLIFLDTEFTDPLDCALISIALVSEDGEHEFYAERTDFPSDWCNGFVRLAVLPRLGQRPGAGASGAELSRRLQAWLKALPESVVLAYDSQTDWELFVDALDGDVPANVTGTMNLKPAQELPVFAHAMSRAHDEQRPWHHALYDVRAQREGWLAAKSAGLT